MIEGRSNAACTVFEGKIVVSGGRRGIRCNIPMMRPMNPGMKSVETYDHHENKWLSFPSMLEYRKDHNAVSINNKMFMIGGFRQTNSCEVFDGVTRKFTFIRSHPTWMKYLSPNRTVCFGSKMCCFVSGIYGKVDVYSYDVEKNDSILETYFMVKNFSCTKVPMY